MAKNALTTNIEVTLAGQGIEGHCGIEYTAPGQATVTFVTADKTVPYAFSTSGGTLSSLTASVSTALIALIEGA